MFSSRLSWDLRPNPISETLTRKRAAGAKILDLTESNPTRAGFEYPAREILAAFGDPRSLRYDPSPAGLDEARDIVAALHGVDRERVMLTTSTSEAYAWLFKLLADPGDEVLVPRPSYPLFEFLAALECVTVRRYPLVYQEGWFIDFDALRAELTSRTRAIVIVNPNNPTGSYLKRGELETLVAICRENHLAIISDEVFAAYSLTADARRVATLTQVEGALTFCLSGLSKVVGLPQMKLGWILIGGALIGTPPLRDQAIERLELIADTYLSVGTPVQYALPALLACKASIQAQIVERLRANLSFLRASGLRALEVEGGWYATIRVPRTRTEEEWVLELLETSDVLVQPGFFYDFDSEAFLVLGLLTPREIFEEGVHRIVARLGEDRSMKVNE